jgi:thiol-disulfide isomerase/thioredoxin
MTAQSIRFVYTDSKGDQQIVASTLGQGAEINRVRQNRNFRDTNKLKVWGGSKMFNAFPQQISEFQGPEPEIFMEEKVNGSFETVARVYSKGSGDIKDKESVCVTLYGFQRYVEDQQVSISNTTTDIVDVAGKLADEIDGSYVIDAPAEADVSGGYPSVDGYSYGGKADRVIQELTRDYNFNLLFTDRTDNNGNNVIRFEPEGFGGAVDTLDSNTTGLVFDNWEKERTENIVNKVEVEAVNSNGVNVTGTASNQDMINKYGVKFERVQLQFVESQSEADLIAEERLKPGKDSNGNDITTPPEGGVVNLPTDTFRQGIENDSVNVVDNELNIDDSFTVSKHKLFYPSGRSELHLDFEDEKLEERAAKDKYLGDRNSELITSVQEDVGNQSVSDNTDGQSVNLQRDQDVDADGSSTDFPKELRRDPNTEIFTDGGSSEIDSSQATETGVNGFAGSFAQLGSINATFSDGEGADMYFSVQVDYDGSNPSIAPTTVGVNHDFVLRDKTNGIDFPQSLITLQTRHTALDTTNDGNVDFVTTETVEGVIHMPENPNGNEYELRAKPSVDVTYGSEIAFVQYDEHDHDDDIEIEDEDGNTRPDMVKSTTAEANITSQPKFTEDGQHVHTIDVTTEQDLIDLLGQDLVNR